MDNNTANSGGKQMEQWPYGSIARWTRDRVIWVRNMAWVIQSVFLGMIRHSQVPLSLLGL